MADPAASHLSNAMQTSSSVRAHLRQMLAHPSSFRRFAAAVTAIAACALAATDTLRADDPVATSVTYNREVVRILQRKCFACHGRGGLAMSLATYRDARPWGRAIREELVEQRMPPSTVAPGASAVIRNPLALTFREMTTLLTWLDGGMPRGDAVDLPVAASLRRSGAAASQADLTLSVPAQTIPALQDLVVQEVTLDTGLTEPRLVSSVTIQPGSRRVLRGALLYADSAGGQGTAAGKGAGTAPRGQWLGSWTPWQPAVAPPGAHGFALAAGARLTLVLYYRGDEAKVTDQPSVELRFAPATSVPAKEVVVSTPQAPAGPRGKTTTLRAETTLAEKTTVWALQPSTDASARTLELVAVQPDGSVHPLVYIPVMRPEWPQALVLKEPLTLPASTRLRLTTGHVAASGSRAQARVAIGVLP